VSTAAWMARILAADAPALAAADTERPDLLPVAAEQGVAALVWDRLSASDEAAAERLCALLGPHVRAAAAREILVQRELQRVLGTMGAAGVRALVMKGGALAYTAYPSPWLRPRADTDLLVGQEEFDGACRTLESCGYARSAAVSTGVLVSHQAAFEHVDGFGLHHVIDLHWKAFNPQLLAGVLPFDHLWRRAVDAPALGPAARVPGPVDALLLASLHRLAHHQGHERLVWLYDVRLLSLAFGTDEWRDVCLQASERGIAGLCLDGLRQARAHLAGSLPSDVEAALAHAARGEPTAIYLAARLRKRDVLASDLAALPTWSARLRLLREHAFPPAAFVLRRYNAHNPAWLPALYAHRLVTGAWKWWLAPDRRL
jgi:hypothetical protein